MKTKIILVSILTVLCCASLAELPRQNHCRAGPRILANGHDYYLLAPDTWTASEVEASNMGGTLALIRTAAELEWVYRRVWQL